MENNEKTEVTHDDLSAAVSDEQGVKYSPDGTRLLSAEDKSLATYTVREGTRVICDRAFNYCSALRQIDIPEGVKSIGNEAFNCCNTLQQINIPKSVMSIESGVFSGCHNLSRIDNHSPHFKVVHDTLYDAGMTRLIVCFSSKAVFTIPKSVTNIGSNAFSYCSSLQHIDIPKGVKSIGNEAFRGCSALQQIIIPEGVKNIGWETFWGCNSLRHIDIPEGVKSIGDGAFWKCNSLRQITIPRGSRERFEQILPVYMMDKLVEAELGNQTAQLYTEVSCKDLAAAIADEHGGKYSPDGTRLLRARGKSIVSYAVMEGTRVICNEAFSGCNTLQQITISEGVTSIGDGAFSGCSELEQIILPDGVTSIGDRAFSGCSALQRIVIPRGSRARFERILPGYMMDKLVETELSNQTAQLYTKVSCDDLAAAILDGQGVKYSPDGTRLLRADYKRLTFTSYTVREGTRVICDGAFSYCSALRQIILPEGVTSIGRGAFSHCSELEQIILPEGMTCIRRGRSADAAHCSR